MDLMTIGLFVNTAIAVAVIVAIVLGFRWVARHR